MTLPNDIIFPFNPSEINTKDPAVLADYMRSLIYTLSRTYQDTAQAINGELDMFTPTVVGSTTDGMANYIRQDGWFYRQGLITDIWADISYTGHTGTGNTQVLVPYQVANSLGNPFVGTAEITSGITLTGGRTYLVSRADPTTFRISLIQCGSALTSIGLPIAGTAAFKIYTRYVGDFIE